MTTGPDNTGPNGRDPDAALTPEERALAERIARLGPQREPAPALDARVLAAARAAVAAPTATPASRRLRSRRRWPMVAGVAATLVLAVGLAWQLRPVDETRVEYSEAPRAAVVLAPGGGPSAADDDAEPVRESASPQQVAAPAPQARMPAADTVAPAPADAKPQAEPKSGSAARAESRSAPPAEPPVVFDAPSPLPMEAPKPPPAGFEQAPPAPPPPPAPVAAQRAAAPQPSAMPPAAGTATNGARIEVMARKQQAQAGNAAAVAGAADGTTAIGNFAVDAAPAKARNEAEAVDARALDRVELDRVETTGERVDRFADQPLDDQPPASADSPQVQEAWLRRVRQLVAEGRIDAARDSLREYQHRYPKATLPDDLHALLEE
jgi:resuscitation-promoting factor RpfA